MKDYTGFVYLWRDSSNGMYYLGSHYGTVDDGYTGSGVRFRRAYKLRPEAFRRRVVEYVQGTKDEMYAREQAWLNLIAVDELNVRYYNQRRRAMGRPEGVRAPRRASPATLEKMRRPKANRENYRKPKSEEHKRKLAEHLLRVKTHRTRDCCLAKHCIVYDDLGQVRYDGMSVQTWCREQGMAGAEVYLQYSARKGGKTIVHNESKMRAHGATDLTVAAHRSVAGWRAEYV